MDNLKRECYRLLQEVVVARDVFCRAPGCGAPCTVAHHVYRRNNLSTAFDPRWSIGLCGPCHNWAHQNPEQFREWVSGYLPNYFDGLKLSRTIVKHLDYASVRINLLSCLGKGRVK